MNFFFKRRALVSWQRANKMRSRGNYAEAIRRYRSIEAEDGLKQIILAQTGDCHFLLNDRTSARSCYISSKDAELEWGGRKRKENSEYIVAYCEYFILMIDRFRDVNTHASEIEEAYSQLLETSPSHDLRTYYLPFPAPPLACQP